MLTPRRLLMTTDAVGGVWRYSLDLAYGLRTLGVETTLLGFGPRPSAAQRVEAERSAELVWSDLPLDWTARDAREVAGVPDVIARRADAIQADVVQINVPSQAARIDLDVPLVVVAHSCVTTWFRVVRGGNPPVQFHWQRQLTQDGFDGAGAVVAPSRAFARLLEECYPGLYPVSVVPNAAATGPTAETKQAYAYAAARWWDEGKNAAVLDAVAGLCKRPLYAAGAAVGPDAQRMRFKHARHLGQLDQERLFDLAASASVFVSPSLYEPFGLAALEAARLGAALVLSDIPTYREIWDGAALFADPHDPAAFASAVDRLMDDDDLRASLALRAERRSADFSVRAQATRMADLYRKLTPQPEAAGAA